jgi:TPR repeat protein
MNQDGFSEEIYEYLLIAAKQGYLPAQFALSEAYFNGLDGRGESVRLGRNCCGTKPSIWKSTSKWKGSEFG